MDQNKINQYNEELKKVNNELKTEQNNLIYMLNKLNIEDINLYNIYIKINDLINKKSLLNKLIDQNKL